MKVGNVRLFSGSADGTIKVWDLESGKETLTLREHTVGVLSLALSVDGKRHFSGSHGTSQARKVSHHPNNGGIAMRVICACFATLLFITLASAGDTGLTLTTATGAVEKIEKEALSIQPRGAGGKFAKKIVLKMTGTTKLTVVSQEKRGGKLVPVQRDFDAKDLEANQQIAVIYITSGTEHTLLSAVVQREPAKK